MAKAMETEPSGRNAGLQGKALERAPQVLVEAAVNFALPLLIYDAVKPAHGEVGGLLASSIPPIAWSVVEFARRRRVDALSVLVLAGIVLSLLAFLGGGGAHMLQLRERLVTALIGLVFLGSVAIRRPLIYQLARAGMARRPDSAGLAGFEDLKDAPLFKRTMTIMTLVWGLGLLAEAAVAAALVWTLPVRTWLMISPLVGYGFMGALGLWTFWFSRRQRRIGRERRATAAAVQNA